MESQSEPHFRVALYSRVSTEEQREGQTIESQVSELEKFAEGKGWTVVKSYKDDGWSGSLLARPELDRLRDDATRRIFDGVLINDVDRLARDVTHLGVIKRDLEHVGIRVIFRKLPGEQSPTQNLLVNILGSFAEFERELISDRTRRGRRHKIEVRKQYLGAKSPYGFRYIPKAKTGGDAGRLEVLPEEAAIVKKMYIWVAQEGLSARQVLRRLNEHRIAPRNRGDGWQKSSVLRILRSEVYAGVWYYNKHRSSEPKKVSGNVYRKLLKSSQLLRPRTEWLPVQLGQELHIVDRSIWERVQDQLNRNLVFSPRNAKHCYLLQGLVRCGACTYAYIGEPAHGKFVYRCSRRCKGYGSIREPDLNKSVWDSVVRALLNPEIILNGVRSWIKGQKDAINADEYSQYAHSAAQIGAEEARIIEAYRLKILNPEQLKRELGAIRQRRESLSQLRKASDASRYEQELTRRSVEEYCQLASQKIRNLDEQQRRMVLRQLVKKIIFEGETIRIIGILPLPPDTERATTAAVDPQPRPVSSIAPNDLAAKADVGNGLSAPTVVHRSGLNEGGFAGTLLYQCGRNDDRFAGTTSYLGGRNHDTGINRTRSSGEILFELVAKVERDMSQKKTANCSNLVKANAALARIRMARKRTRH